MKISKHQVELICKRLREDLIRFSFLASGNHNDNYLIKTSKDKYVLRIENNPQFKNLNKEYNLLKSIKPGLGPKVYFFDKSHKIIPADYFVEEFIEGKHPTKPNKKFIILMAKWLKSLHRQKKDCKKYSLLEAVKPYYKNFRNYRDALSSNIANEIDILFGKVNVFCKKNDDLFGSRTKCSLLHGDLSRKNIMYDGEQVRLLDWEFSNYGFPEWDIVYFFESQKLNNTLKNVFLKTYGYQNTASGKNRLMTISLLNTCGNIGYSVWRLGLVKKGKIAKGQKNQILKRLKQDIKVLKEIIN